MSSARATFEGWAIVELMGHRRLAGSVSEVTMFGTSFMRLDVPSDPPVTQFYGGSAIYAVTPTTEDIARRISAQSRPTPVHAYELPAPSRIPAEEDDDGDDGDDGDSAEHGSDELDDGDGDAIERNQVADKDEAI
jgi:hypothetical protein